MKKIYFLLLLILPILAYSQYAVDFEGDGETKTAYASGTVNLSGTDWDMTEALIGTAAADFKNGLRSARLRGYGTSSMTMLANKPNGIGTIQFNYRRYGTDIQVDWKVEYSNNDGVDWIPIGDVFTAPSSDDVQVFSENVNVDGDVRIRIKRETESGGSNRRLNIDDLIITDFGVVAPPSISVSSPSNNFTFNPFVTDVDVALIVSNFTVGNDPGDDGFIKYSVNGAATINKFDTNPISLAGLTPGDYTVDFELVDTGGNSLAPAVTTSVAFSIANINTVTDIAAVKADFANDGAGKYYQLSSEAIVTYIRTNRNQKYIEDGTGGMLIDDPDAIITSTLSENDGILNFKFQSSVFNGTLQARPLENISANSNGNTITPTVLTIEAYVANFVQYESTLIQFNNVTISEGDGSIVFATNTNYTVTDGIDTVVFRTIFSEADYIGEIIPSVADNRIFLAGRFNSTPQVVAKNLQDLALSTEQFTASSFSLYPNPVTNGSVTISSNSADAMQVQVYDVLGKVVKNEILSNNTLDVSNLNTGLYILKITQNQNSVTKKLVIK